MKNFSKIALLAVLSFLTTSQVFTALPGENAVPLATGSSVGEKTDPTPLPAEALAKPIDGPKLVEGAAPAELKKEEDKVVPASVAPEKELAAPAAPAKSSWSLSSAFSGAISSFKGLFTSKSTPEVKKEESKPTTAEPSADSVKTTEPLAVETEKLAPKEPLAPMTDAEKAAFLADSSPLKKSSSALATATALATGIKLPTAAPSIEPTTKTPEPEKVMPSPTVEEEKVLTLKTGSATRAAQAATEKIATEDDVLDVPASKKEVDEAALTIKATANPTDTAELKIIDYWETKNTKDRRATQIKRTLAAAAITTLAGGLIGITVVLPIVLRIMAKKLEAEEQAHLERLQAEARGAQAKLDSLGEAATDLDKMMVQQLGLDPDRLYKDSAFNKERGKETQSPTLKKLFRMLNHEPKQFLDAVEILREKEVAKLLTPREQEQLSIIRNLRPEDVAPLGFFGSLGKFFGFGPQSNETLDKIKSSWKKEYSPDDIAKFKEKHGAKTTTSEPAKKGEDDQKLKTTPPTEAPVDAAKKPKTQEELASEAAAKKQSLLDSEYPEQVVEKMLSQEAINQMPKKKGTLIPEMTTLDEIVKPEPKTAGPVLSETEKKEKTPLPPATAPQPGKIADPLEREEVKQLPPRPSTAAAYVKREPKKGTTVAVSTELTEEVEKALPVTDKTVPLPEETKKIVPTEPDKAPAPTVPAKAPDLVAANSTLDQIKVPPPVPVKPVPEEKVATLEKTPPLSPEAETEKTANLAFDAARKALDEAIKIPVNDSEPKAKAEKTKKIQEAEESLSIAEGNLKRAQEAARDESELNETKKKSTQEIVKTTDQIINPTELATVIAKTQSQFKELPPAPTLEDQKIPPGDDWPPKVSTQLQSHKNQTPLTKESTQKAVGVVTEEIKQNAPIVAFSQQSGSSVKTVPQAPIKLNLRSAIPQPVPVEPSNVALTIKEKMAAASEEKKAQQIFPEDAIKALQAQITEETQKKSLTQRELDRARSYENDRPDPNNDNDLRMSVNDNIWKLAQEQQSKTQGLPQNSLTDPTQFMSRRSDRPVPLPPQTDNWGPNPEVERLTQSVGFGFGSQDPVVISTTEKQAILDRAKQLRPQVTAALAEQGRTNPPSSPRSPIEVKNSPGRFWSANTTDRSLEEIETARQKGLSMINQGPPKLQSPAVIRPEDIQRQFSTNPPPQKIGSFIKKTK